MADDASFGGIISITIDNQRIPPTEADITIEPTNIEIEAKANQDGSPCYSGKPKLFRADITFRDKSGIVWKDNMLKSGINVTISEETNGRTHMFTGARITGSPKLNLSSGEVSGLMIEGPQYQKLNS